MKPTLMLLMLFPLSAMVACGNASTSEGPLILPDNYYTKTKCQLNDEDPGHCIAISPDVATEMTFGMMITKMEKNLECSSEQFVAASGYEDVLDMTPHEYAASIGVDKKYYSFLGTCSPEIATEVRALVAAEYNSP